MKVVVGLGCGSGVCGIGVCGIGVCGSGVCGSGVCGCVPPGIASLGSVIADWDCRVSSGTSSNRGSKEASERTSESTTIGCKMLSLV